MTALATTRFSTFTSGLVVIALFLSGCSSSRSQTTLTSLQRQEANRELTPFSDLPTLLDSATLAPVDEDDPRAWLTLDGAMLAIDKPVFPRATQVRNGEPTDQEKLRALRLYAEGKAARVDDEIDIAIEALLECVQLDPEFPEPWLELALAHRQGGDRLASTAAFRNVLARDPNNILSLTFVGIEALNRREYDTASAYLARSWSLRDAIDSNAHRYIISVQLGHALRQLGYLSASLEAFNAVGVSTRVAPPAHLENVFNELLNAQAELWRDTGDMAMRLRRLDEASDAYARASSLPSFNPDALLARRIAALAMRGQGASAATLLLDTIGASDAQTSETQLALARYLSRDATLANAMGVALDEIESRLTPEQRRLVSTDLLLTRCAMLARDEARDRLQDYLALNPHEERVVDALYEVLGSINSSESRRSTLTLISATPFKYLAYSQSLVGTYPDIDEHLDALLPLRGNSLERALLASQLLILQDRDDEARALLDETITRLGPLPPLMTSLSQLALRRGDSDSALAALDALEGDTRMDALARAWILRAMGRYEEAYEQLQPILDVGATPPPSPEELMMGAQLCVAREQHALGESLLERTIELYPRFEEAHAELIGLYSQSGPLRDPDKFSQSIIALRRVAPSSKTIRWLRAQELLRSGQYNRAEQELLSLASERLTRPVVDMLVTLWIRTGSPERAEQWLLEQRQMSPSDPLFVSKLAEVYSQSDRAQEGADLLEAWLERRPGEMAISRQLESLYRTQLDNHARANALAQRRLERAPESPQRSLELAALYRTNRELSSSLRALEELLALRPTMSPGQWNQLYQESLLLAQGALNGDLDEGARVARFFGIVLDQAASPPDELHRIHVMLLLDTEAGVDDVLASIIRSHEANPATSSNLFDIATTLYYQRNDMGSAITIASRAMAQLDSPSQTLVSTLMQACYFELDIDNALQAVRAAERGGYARELTTIDQRNINITVDEQAASELLYNFGVWFAVNGRIEESHRIYRAALEYNPDHVMANNNLGYSLADLDMSIDEAHRLILRAYSLDSTQGSITDSLGWVRYKLGILDDTLDEQGVVTQEGAITLLTRATTMDGARDDPIVHDHLADALWVSGRVDEARKHWTTAASFLDTIPQLDPDRANPGELFLQEESRRLRESIRLKLDALDNSQAPPVASSAATRDDDPSGM